MSPENIKSPENTKQRLDKISERNATTSPLLRLPAEIRNEIFALAMSHGTISLDSSPSTKDRQILQDRHNIPPSSAPLLFVCRQIHAEVALLPYRLNKFIVSGKYLSAMREFLKRRTPEQLELMRDVRWRWPTHGSPSRMFSGEGWLKWFEDADEQAGMVLR
ncbi:hypothetical protein J4E86_007961 [Alternaria arbusti]|uniref:uncharacterized protein n=1 Tax=Alternaria arbusti TaxID=232088 RepID=UPI00221FA00A|nr:uncharacterized protein J4E86_007961 [Alternaria arbusti]KAI4948613.1 hypothetical protein J4E86_007961 [Alternaria arbusti]